MATLSINSAWEESAAFLKRDGQYLFLIAFLLVALPPALLQVVGEGGGVGQPGELPAAGLWLLLVPLVMVASLIGTLAMSYLAIRGGTTVGEALAVAVRRLLPMLGAALLVAAAAIAIAAAVAVAVGIRVEPGGIAPLTGGQGLAMFALFLVFLALWVRLMLMTPAAAAERLGPIGIIRRSWQLTSGHFWRLLGFILLCVIVAVVVVIAVSLVFGILIALTAGPPEPGSISAFLALLIGTVVEAALATVFATLIARIYVQLAGVAPTEVFA